ncbi:MAG: PEP-CTERM sorting domain-containing protein [Planctomycetota bacterium]
MNLTYPKPARPSFFVAAVLTALAVCLGARSADAQQAFSFAASSEEMLLAYPDDMMVQKIVEWQSPLVRAINQSRPFLQVTNSTGGSVMPANIETFTITIGDTAFNFGDAVLGDFAVLGDTSTDGVIIESVTPLNNGDAIQVKFGNGGLAPGEVARFQVDIDHDDPGAGGFVYPDFRSVFYDVVEEGSPTSTADNSQITAVFVEGADTLDLSTTLPDQTVPVGSIGSSVIVNSFFSYGTEVPLDNFEIPPVEIPEPATMVLSVLGLLGCISGFTRRRLS